MQHKQQPPYCVSLCLSTGCNLQCDFCGINGTQVNPKQEKHFMSLETAEAISKNIAKAGWNCRIELGAYGESTLNPNWKEIIAILRKHNPKNQIMLLTNGYGILKGDVTDNVMDFFKAGGTKLGIEQYTHYNLYAKILKRISLMDIEFDGIPVYYYPTNKKGNPHTKDNKRALIFVENLLDNTNGTHSTIINMAGAAGKLSDKRIDKKCAHPFRKLIFRSNGDVPICCNDWLGDYHIENIHNMSIDDIWQHERFQVARKFTYHGMRDKLRPCNGCDAMTYRNGLLPDSSGQGDIELPTEDDIEFVSKLTEGGPALPVTQQAIDNVIDYLPDEAKETWDLVNVLEK